MEAATAKLGVRATAASDERLRELVVALAARNGQLEHALESRIVIEQAKGMLAERWSVPPETAFELLRSAARARRIRVRDLAAGVLASHSTPPELAEVEPRR